MDDLVIPAQGWRPRKLSEGTSLLIKAVLARSWDQSDLLNLDITGECSASLHQIILRWRQKYFFFYILNILPEELKDTILDILIAIELFPLSHV